MNTLFDKLPSGEPRYSLTTTEQVFCCRVYGDPKPQGSKRAFVIPGKAGGKARAIITESNKKQGNWRDTMSNAFVAERPANSTAPTFVKCAVNVAAVFIMPRPKSAKKDAKPIVAPDLDKLFRTLGDSLQESCVLSNDSMIVSWDGSKKRYQEPGEPVGVEVKITAC